MARLVITTAGFSSQVLELNLGVNRVGRSPGNDFQIEHPTISARHCDIVVGEGELLVRDCSSTNGTFVGEERVREASLRTGQSLRLGEIELLVESTDVTIAIPQFEMPRPAPPVVLSDGGLVCPRHPEAIATYQCTHCLEVLCDSCVHRLRRRGGKILTLCPLCSHKCAPIRAEKIKKKSLLGFLRKTVKLPFIRQRDRE